MDIKKISGIAVSTLVLALFVPVFVNVILIGNNMNYNPRHKIYALYGNKSLLLMALIGVLILALVYLVVRKIPFNLKTAIGYVIFTGLVSILFYFINVEISKCIAFYGGWDCGMVANSARWVYEGKGMGYGDYYQIFTNNVPITWLLNRLYKFSVELPGYPYNPEFIWIQFQCIVHAFVVFLASVIVLLISKNIGMSTMALIANAVLLGLSPWKTIPYTDASTIAFPVIVLFLYVLFGQIKSKWRYFIWFLIALVGIFGGIMKATCYVLIIAIVLLEFLWIVFAKEGAVRKIREVLLRTTLFLGGLMLALMCKKGMYDTLDYEYKQDYDIGWVGFFYDGLKEKTTGASSADGYQIACEYAGQPKEIRDAYVMQCVKERIGEKGFWGLLDFWLRKQVMTFNDGTFSWYQEGHFHSREYPDITDSTWKESLRSFYWKEGENYSYFVTISHALWLVILVGIIIEAGDILWSIVYSLKRNKHDEIVQTEKADVRIVNGLVFVGSFLFVMLFEGRARYLYNCIPLFIVMAICGYCGIADKVVKFVSKKTDK